MIEKNWSSFWNDKKIFGVELFKISFLFKKYLWILLRIKLPKVKNQKIHWNSTRGEVYKDEFLNSNYHKIETFYQDYFIQIIKKLKFQSVLELGCGFGWNLIRIDREFECSIYGIDFSKPQIENSKSFLNNNKIQIIEGNVTKLPYENESIDLLFTFGVLQDLHYSEINQAVNEIIRVSKKYIVHVESNEKYYTRQLQNNRIFKTHIISHDLSKTYKSKGLSIEFFASYKDLIKDFENFKANIQYEHKRWEPMEDCSKYTFSVFKKN
jgi:ubiquinone/menaquinone biosynthesis C-methylase UbiE